MISYATHRHLYWVSSALVFIFFAVVLSGEAPGMFGDSDMLWHIAAGDYIRKIGEVPMLDPWSFTAGDHRWINVAWLWDIAFSYLHEHFGWHGPVVMNAVTIAITLAILFAHGLLRSGDNLIPIVIALIGVILMMTVILRPMQVTHLMTAIWMLILAQHSRGLCSHRWLLVMPPLMLLWVNCHGGFIVGLMALGFFFTQAWLTKKKPEAIWLFCIGAACFAATFINPFGWRVYELHWVMLSIPSKAYISEWLPLTLSYSTLLLNLLAVIFILLVPRNNSLNFSHAERWFAYVWLIMGVTSMRNMSIFAVVAFPLVVAALAQYLKPSAATPNPTARAIADRCLALLNRKQAAVSALLASAALVPFLFSPNAMRWLTIDFKPISIKSEIAFIEQHIASPRVLNHYNLGGYLIYESRGRVPVFVDPRAETIFPSSLMQEYWNFQSGSQDWDGILNRYHINAIMIPNKKTMPGHDRLHGYLAMLPGWRLAFEGPIAVIYVRTDVTN